MGCCDKLMTMAKKPINIAKGVTAVAVGKRYEFTDTRIRICHKCDKVKWIGRQIFCSICKCWIPAKARVEDEKCPEGRWSKEHLGTVGDSDHGREQNKSNTSINEVF
jgi:hypothetical protein